MTTMRWSSRNLGQALITFALTLLAALVLLSACDDAKPAPAEDADIPRVVEAHNRLGTLALKQLLSQANGENKNVFLSPTSIALALSMALNGADGETAQGMARALHYADWLSDGFSIDAVNSANLALLQALDSAPGVRLDIANSIWHRQELAFNEAFLDQNRQFYRARVEGLDFNAPQSADVINDWVSDATQGLIPSVVERLDPDLVMTLINAVYFQGEWTAPFNPSLTRDMPFRLATGERQNVPTMARDGRIDYYEDDFQAIRLPYGDDQRLAMYLFLPPSDEDIHAFVERFVDEAMARSFERFAPAFGEIFVPRMNVAYKTKLNATLQALGMEEAFRPGSANFSRMLAGGSTRQLYISDVVHQSVLKVDEEGTEAAAVTSVDVRVTSLPLYDFTFRADRPFLIVIRDDHTEALLFLGVIGDPQAGSAS